VNYVKAKERTVSYILILIGSNGIEWKEVSISVLQLSLRIEMYRGGQSVRTMMFPKSEVRVRGCCVVFVCSGPNQI
jgi:hypothetical protein